MLFASSLAISAFAATVAASSNATSPYTLPPGFNVGAVPETQRSMSLFSSIRSIANHQTPGAWRSVTLVPRCVVVSPRPTRATRYVTLRNR